MSRVEIWIPLIVGIGVTAVTIVIHGTALFAIVHWVRHERAVEHLGAGFWPDLGIVAIAVLIALIAHLTEIGTWALLFLLFGEFQAFGMAFYHSAVNYTTLGYGDIVMSPAWRSLGPIEAADGLLMFGFSTAMIYAVIQRMFRVRFPDLPD